MIGCREGSASGIGRHEEALVLPCADTVRLVGFDPDVHPGRVVNGGEEVKVGQREVAVRVEGGGDAVLRLPECKRRGG